MSFIVSHMYCEDRHCADEVPSIGLIISNTGTIVSVCLLFLLR